MTPDNTNDAARAQDDAEELAADILLNSGAGDAAPPSHRSAPSPHQPHPVIPRPTAPSGPTAAPTPSTGRGLPSPRSRLRQRVLMLLACLALFGPGVGLVGLHFLFPGKSSLET